MSCVRPVGQRCGDDQLTTDHTSVRCDEIISLHPSCAHAQVTPSGTAAAVTSVLWQLLVSPVGIHGNVYTQFAGFLPLSKSKAVTSMPLEQSGSSQNTKLCLAWWRVLEDSVWVAERRWDIQTSLKYYPHCRTQTGNFHIQKLTLKWSLYAVSQRRLSAM